MSDVAVRAAGAADGPAIAGVVRRAFGRDAEALLVERLHARGEDVIALVAVEGDRIVGHVVASPITMEPPVEGTFLGIAPLSVEPDRQGRGVGSRLMRAVLDAAREHGVAALFLLGNPRYYARFGFRTTHVGNAYGASASFMALELEPGSLDGVTGTASYVSAFDESGT